jgi:superfamily I DNA/RNA helicase
MLAQNLIEVKYDLSMADETQDMSKIALDIFKLIKADRKVICGDRFQDIYSEFMGTVNAFTELDDIVIYPLTQSFRCSVDISKKIDRFGKYYFSSNFIFNGTDKPKEYKTKGYMTLTNAQIIYRINELHKKGIRYSLTRRLKDIFACPLALITAASGKRVYSHKYKFLEDEYKRCKAWSNMSFYAWLGKEVKDEEVKSAIALLNKLKANEVNIFDILEDAKKSKKDPNVLVATAYSAKGLTFNSVYIEDDLNDKINKIMKRNGPHTDEEDTLMKVAYVAATRGEHELINCKYL